MFKKQLEETLPRPFKPTALKYIQTPKFVDTDLDQINTVNFTLPRPAKRRLNKGRVRTFRLIGGESDIDSFSSASYKSCRSSQSQQKPTNFKMRSKSDIVIGTNIYQDEESISDWAKHSEFFDLVYV